MPVSFSFGRRPPLRRAVVRRRRLGRKKATQSHRSQIGQRSVREENALDLEETLAKVAELSREELHIVRKRAEEKTPARDHGHDFNEMRNAADRLDHYAHVLRRLHDNELGQNWRHESLADRT
jgi:hypothetical protein